MSKSKLLAVSATLLIWTTGGCGGLEPGEEGQLTLADNALTPRVAAKTKGPFTKFSKVTKSKLSPCFMYCMKNGFEVIVGNAVNIISNPSAVQCTAYCAGAQIPGVNYENQEGETGTTLGDCTDECMNGCEPENPSQELPDEEYFPALDDYCGCLGLCGCPC